MRYQHWHYRTTGHPAQPVLLFLHGFMGSGEDWQAVAEQFSREYYCILPDLPGHGQSDFPLSEAYFSLPAVAEQLIQLLDHLQIERCTVVGYSMGGRLALYLLRHHPERFQAGVLESASPGLKTAAEREARRQRDEALARKILCSDFPTFLKRWYAQPLFASLRRHPDFPALLQHRLVNRPEGLAASLRWMGTGAQPSLWESLKNNKLPLLLLSGEFDIKFRDIAREMAVSNPFIRAETIAQCGHNIHFEKPQAFVAAVRKFLTKLPG